MKVETYECQETIAEHPEIAEEAIKYIEELGLKGQISLLSPKTEEKPQSRCPYRKMKKDERFIYRTLCPDTFSAEAFSECPIPIRVLQVFSHAKSLGIFKKYQIWCTGSQAKDPILVAYDSDAWNAEPFILARWAEELDEWSILVKKATQKIKENWKLKLAKIKDEVIRDISLLDSIESIDKLMDEPSYYSRF